MRPQPAGWGVWCGFTTSSYHGWVWSLSDTQWTRSLDACCLPSWMNSWCHISWLHMMVSLAWNTPSSQLALMWSPRFEEVLMYWLCAIWSLSTRWKGLWHLCKAPQDRHSHKDGMVLYNPWHCPGDCSLLSIVVWMEIIIWFNWFPAEWNYFPNQASPWSWGSNTQALFRDHLSASGCHLNVWFFRVMGIPEAEIDLYMAVTYGNPLSTVTLFN